MGVRGQTRTPVRPPSRWRTRHACWIWPTRGWLRALFDEVRPDIIVPEVEAIATGELSDAAARGVQVVPSAEIAAICMDRERLRVLAHEDLGLPTTPYRFAGSLRSCAPGRGRSGTHAWSSR